MGIEEEISVPESLNLYSLLAKVKLSSSSFSYVLKLGFMQVHEGRNHEVRELVKNAGLKVSVGGLMMQHFRHFKRGCRLNIQRHWITIFFLGAYLLT